MMSEQAPELQFSALRIRCLSRALAAVRSVTAFLAGDLDAARDVQLDLPETVVCSANPEDSVNGGSCCGGPVPVSVGLGTGIAGGLFSAPLPLLEAPKDGSACR